MTTLGNNPFPVITLAEQAANPASPTAGNQRLCIKTDHAPYHVNSDGVAAEVGNAAEPNTSILLGAKSYGGGTYVTLNSTTLVDVDATNCAVTFTAPSSGNVIVRIMADFHATYNVYFGVREGTNIIGAKHFAGYPTDWITASMCEFRFTGLSAGSHTYKVAACSDSEVVDIYEYTDHSVTIEVWAE